MLNFRDDPTAFRAFITEHQDKVFNLVLNKVQQLEDAEEITQDVFVDVFRKPEAFRGESSVKIGLFERDFPISKLLTTHFGGHTSYSINLKLVTVIVDSGLKYLNGDLYKL